MPLRRLLSLLSIALVCIAPAFSAARTILVFGDSLTAGYGLDDPATQAYPALLQQKINALAATPVAPAPSSSSSSLAAPSAPRWRVVNAGLSGDTSSGGLRRIDWILRQPVDIFILELGANDGLRGLPLDLIRRNLLAIAAKVRAKNPSVRIVLAGMRMPPSMGDYAVRYDRLFPELAAEQGWTLVPFLLQNVGGVRELNLPDGIHPTAAGHKIVADTVWPHLLPLL